jgi:WD40 repeat protein
VRWILGRDFFISYTRRDAARYAARLARLLGERHSVYLDQLDIPQGAELPPRLVRAVRRASTVVLVGSPAALDSHWVRRELIEFGRTGRPVLLLDIAGALDAAPWHEPPWSALAGVYRQQETRAAFDAGEVSQDVLEWVRDSFKYARQTTRLRRAVALTLLVLGMAGLASLLVVRAARATVTEAEQQASAAGRRAADAQSRAADATRRQEAADASANAARQAERAAKDAETAARQLEAAAREDAATQLRVALSRRLAGLSSTTVGPQPDLGLLLAVSAQEAFPTTEASRALFGGLARYPALERLVRGTHRIAVWSMARSADGRLLATLDMTGGAWLWDVASMRPLAQLVPPNEKGGLDGFNLGTIALSPAGDLLAIPLQDELGLWDTRTYRRVGTVAGDAITQLAFTGSRTLVITSDTGMRFWDVAEPAAPRETGKPLSIPGVLTFAVEPQTGALIARTTDGVVLCYVDRCDPKEQTATFESGSRNMSVAIARRDTGIVAVAVEPDGDIAVFRDQEPEFVLPFRLPQGITMGGEGQAAPMHALAFSQDGRELAIAAVGGLVITGLEGLAGRDEAPTRVLPYDAVIGSVEFPRSDRTVVGHTDGSIGVLDPGRAIAASETYRHTPLATGTALATAFRVVSGDGRRVAMTANERLEAWSVADGETGREFPRVHTGTIERLALSADGERVATVGPVGPGNGGTALVIWSWEGRELSRVALPRQPTRNGLHALRFGGAADDPWLLVALSGGGINVYGVRDPSRPVLRFTTAVPSLIQVAVRDDGRAIAVEAGATIHVRDAAGGLHLDLPSPHLVNAMAFSADGRRLMLVEQGQADMFLTVWNLARTSVGASRATLYSGQEAFARLGLKDDPSELRDPAFSPDGRLLVFRNGAALSLWDTVNRVELAALPLPSEFAALSFSADGSRVLALDGRSLTRIAVDTRALQRRACAMAGRTFSDAEVARYLDGDRRSRPCASTK